MPPTPHRTVELTGPPAPNPYDPPTHPELRAVGYEPDYDPGYADLGTPQDPAQDPAQDPVDHPGEARTEVFAAIPAQHAPADVDPVADPTVAAAWAGHPQADPVWEPAPHQTWDRPDYDENDPYAQYDDPPGYRDEQAEQAVPAGPSRGRTAALLVPVAVGIAVSVGLGVYGRLHEGTGTAINLAGFSSGIAAKSWLTAAAFVLVLVQVWTSMRMYGRLAKSRPAGPRTATLHRWSGRVAVLLTIPVAVHCLYALGFEDSSMRVLLHSLFGCFFYGAFAAKMLLLPKRDAPRWVLPIFGGLVFVLLTGLFLTSSVWFFSTKGLTF
ncbi:DUF6529 family protein [Pseudonocardia pini]|uniref:DUF6529 family protein n=1 Tax=Pseudonocardia pini TaxID=2758030 RepID=UPI001C6921CC|nr:DUF6529 family protein [Pseudonocardia pini]